MFPESVQGKNDIPPREAGGRVHQHPGGVAMLQRAGGLRERDLSDRDPIGGGQTPQSGLLHPAQRQVGPAVCVAWL